MVTQKFFTNLSDHDIDDLTGYGNLLDDGLALDLLCDLGISLCSGDGVLLGAAYGQQNGGAHLS